MSRAKTAVFSLNSFYLKLEAVRNPVIVVRTGAIPLLRTRVSVRATTMPEETKTTVDYRMEAASGAHFSGLRLDGLLSSSPSSSSASPLSLRSSAADSSNLADANAPKQPFVIGTLTPFSSHFKRAAIQLVFRLIRAFDLVSATAFFFQFDCCSTDRAGVSGGTASGKTTVCDMIIQQLHDHRVVLVNQVRVPW